MRLEGDATKYELAALTPLNSNSFRNDKTVGIGSGMVSRLSHPNKKVVASAVTRNGMMNERFMDIVSSVSLVAKTNSKLGLANAA